MRLPACLPAQGWCGQVPIFTLKIAKVSFTVTISLVSCSPHHRPAAERRQRPGDGLRRRLRLRRPRHRLRHRARRLLRRRAGAAGVLRRRARPQLLGAGPQLRRPRALVLLRVPQADPEHGQPGGEGPRRGRGALQVVRRAQRAERAGCRAEAGKGRGSSARPRPPAAARYSHVHAHSHVDEEDGRMGRTIYIKLIFDEE